MSDSIPNVLAGREWWSVVHGDCFDVLRLLPNKAVVVMDPPYGISHASNHGASWQGTTIANDGDTSARDKFLTICDAFGIPWACFGTWKRTPPANTRGCLVWDKGPAFGMGDLSFPWKGSWEEIYIGGKGWHGTRDEGVLRGHIVPSWESAGRKHPHQKPVSLLRYLLSKAPDGIVIDPFCGSGSTGVAAIQEGRQFIGVELDASYVGIARGRIADAAAQGNLFAEAR